MVLVILKQITVSSLTGKRAKWEEGKLTTDNTLHIHEGSTALHYGQQCFEGLKAYRCKDGSINLFHPQANAERYSTYRRPSFNAACAQLNYSLRACKEVVKTGQDWLGPYGSWCSLILTSISWLVVGENIGVKA